MGFLVDASEGGVVDGGGGGGGGAVIGAAGGLGVSPDQGRS